MLKNIRQRLFQVLPAVIVSVFVITGVIYAWSEPTQSPPQGNVSAPLNVGPNGQAKEGNLILNYGGAWLNALLIPFGRVGIGTLAPTQPLDLNNTGRIANVQDPINGKDVATKDYVDAQVGTKSGSVSALSARFASKELGYVAAAACRDLSARAQFAIDGSNITTTYTDWHLPTQEELAVFLGVSDYNLLWTSTVSERGGGYWIVLVLSDGIWSTTTSFSPSYLRCVR